MGHVESVLSNLDIAKNAYQLFKEGNVPSFMDLHHDDVVYEIMGEPEIPYAGTYKGKEEVKKLLRKIDDTIEFTKFEPKKFIVEGDDVAVVIDSECIVKSTGKKVQRDLVHLLEIKDGKANYLRDFFDTHRFVESLR